MNILLHELRAYRKSTIIWTISLVGTAALFMSFFPAFTKDTEEFTKLLEGYPAALREAFGINLNNFFSILGFYCYGLSFVTLCGAIQAMNLGTSIVSKEVREKTADFLLTKPVTRTTVLTNKLLAALISIILTNIVYIGAATLLAFQVATEDFSVSIFILLSLTVFLVQMLFLAIGIIISVIVSRIKSVLTVSLATVFAFYFLGMFSADEAKRYLSPFKYFDTAYIMENASYETSFLITGAALMILAIGASYFIYAKKDIHSV
ncbi:ABC-2 type transport system permease protein [Neobacillus niacini]|uniref:ABC transporter permease subunit n=1 Tax=Neobacillus niacini TaxID=86668 RepID=UPI00286543C2|nr:ABC transporter permease subunit [Neobacillus niacini]MDR7078718.1 ABC-2 type transport system permease protein [Neobacillus niacini]